MTTTASQLLPGDEIRLPGLSPRPIRVLDVTRGPWLTQDDDFVWILAIVFDDSAPKISKLLPFGIDAEIEVVR